MACGGLFVNSSKPVHPTDLHLLAPLEKLPHGAKEGDQCEGGCDLLAPCYACHPNYIRFRLPLVTDVEELTSGLLAYLDR